MGAFDGSAVGMGLGVGASGRGRRRGARWRDDRPGVGTAAPPATEGDDGERRQDHGRKAEGDGRREAQSLWAIGSDGVHVQMSFVCGLFDKRDGESDRAVSSSVSAD